MELVQFALLGIGPSAIYALAGLGIVTIYQGSGVLNFAQGAMALLGAWLFARMSVDWGWPRYLSIVVAIAAISALSAVIYLLVMRPLRGAAPLVRVIATLGVLAAVQQGVILVFGSDLKLVPSFLPKGRWSLGNDVRLGYDRVTLLVIALVGTVLLTLLYRRTRFGFATRAAAENRRAASALGVSPDRIGVVNWAIGGALAAAAGILTVPISGLNLDGLVLLVVPALAAALVGGFTSFTVTMIAALGIGMGESVLSRYVATPGAQQALPFVVIIVVLVIRGHAMPTRDEEGQRLPRAGRGRPRLGVAAIAGALLVAAIWSASTGMVSALTTTMVTAIVLLSLVVLTGYAGQISLGQYGLAGFGAFAAGRATFSLGFPFPAAAAFGVAAAVVVGLLFAVPSLRTRGVSLAVVTMGMALALEKVVFGNHTLIRGTAGTPVGKPTLFGWNIDALFEPRRYATVVVVALLVIAVIAANVRSGGLGRRLLAVRSNERAATALGINVARVKFFAFGLASGIAAVGGIFMGFRGSTVRYDSFGVMSSINAVVYVIIGGVGFVHGAIIGSLMAPATLVNFLLQSIGDLDHYLVLGGGVLLVITLIFNPVGLAVAHVEMADVVRARWRALRGRAPRPATVAALGASAVEPVTPHALSAEGITVDYGGVRALDDVSLELRPGSITGLIGANGAGKTTFIDAVSGFTASTGRFLLDGAPISEWNACRRARGGIGRTFQSLELFEDLTVRENLLAPTDRLRWWHWLVGLARPTTDELDPAAAALVERFELGPWLDRNPSEMPFGLRRLLSVARAAARRPSILLVDEPAAGLNEHESRELGEALRWLAETWGMAILLVEHDVGLVMAISDEVVAIDFGKRIFCGSPRAARSDQAVRSAYLGELDSGSAEPVPDRSDLPTGSTV